MPSFFFAHKSSFGIPTFQLFMLVDFHRTVVFKSQSLACLLWFAMYSDVGNLFDALALFEWASYDLAQWGLNRTGA